MDGREGTGLEGRCQGHFCFAVEKVKKLRSGKGREAKKGQSHMSLSLEFVLLFFLVD